MNHTLKSFGPDPKNCSGNDVKHGSHYNRPRLPAIRYRLGSYATFFKRMTERLRYQSVSMEAGGMKRPLAALTVRTTDDPTIAVLDACAIVADVLAFYQERIANEAFLRTATERRSVLELAKALGYALNPGVAASVHLAITVEDAPGMSGDVNIPKGLGVQSIPGEGELPQAFETIEDIKARSEWNLLRPNNPMETVWPETGLGTTSLRLKGVHTGLLPGDSILLAGDERESDPGSERWDVRDIKSVDLEPKEGYTEIIWEKGLGSVWPPVMPAEKPGIFVFRKRAALFGHNAPEWEELPVEAKEKYADEEYGKVTSVALAPDGRTAVAGCTDSNLRVWDTDTGKLLRTLTGHEAGVNGLDISPDGKKVVSVGDDKKLVVQFISAYGDPVTIAQNDCKLGCVAFHSSGKQIAAGGEDGTITVWTEQKGTWGELLKLETVHDGPVTSVAFSPDGGYLASGGDDGTARIYELSGDGDSWSETAASPLRGHTDGVTSVAFSPNGGYLASGGDDKTVRVWKLSDDGNSWTEIPASPLKGHTDSVTSVVFLSEGRKIISACADKSLMLWEIKERGQGSWFEIRPLTGHTDGVTSVAVSKDGRLAVSGSDDRTVKVWDVESASEINSLSKRGEIEKPDWWPDRPLEAGKTIDLDSTYPKIFADSWIVLRNPNYAQTCQNYIELYKVEDVSTERRSDFTITEKITRLSLDTDESMGKFSLRDTEVLIQSEQLDMFTVLVRKNVPVYGNSIELDSFVQGLEPGRTVIVSGKRRRVKIDKKEDRPPDKIGLQTDFPLVVLRPPEEGEKTWHLMDRNGFKQLITTDTFKVTGMPAHGEDDTVSETALIQSVDNDGELTRLTFKEPLKNYYDRPTVTIHANMASATHGESVEEVLGSGNGAEVNQNFELKKPPLTYVPAPTSTGGTDTLNVRVNGVLWSEAKFLYDLGANDRKYIVRIDDDGRTAVTFGDGECGARLPSGQENIKAEYRSGIGKGGEVGAGTLTLLKTKPLGLKEVTNPLPASGAAERETMNEAKTKAPLSVLTLERIVSLNDFENFARGFAGIGKAQAVALWSGESRIAHLTIAGVNGKKVPRESGLYKNLLKGLKIAGDPAQRVVVDNYLPKFFNVAARVMVDSRYETEAVHKKIKSSLNSAFDFEKRSFGEALALSDVVAVIQGVEGVKAVDIDAIYEKSKSEGFKAILTVSRAGLIDNKIAPAELLLLKPGGIELLEMTR